MLLIDEVDKTDVEVEGLLLEVLSDFQVTIPELGTVSATRRPFVVLTSNASRELSEAVKRRCLFLHLDYPDAERERAIVTSQVPGLDDKVAAQLVDVVVRLRELELKKAPSIAESVDWARTLIALQIGDLDEATVARTLGVVLKHASDQQRAIKELKLPPMSLLDTHIGFVEALRSAGLSVSLAEGLDAISALEKVRWHDRETVRAAYAATLVKRQPQRVTFDAVFDIYYPRLIGGGVAGEEAASRRRTDRPTPDPSWPGSARRWPRRWPPATSRRCRTLQSRRWRASARCPAGGRGCRAGRRTPPSSGSRPPS